MFTHLKRGFYKGIFKVLRRLLIVLKSTSGIWWFKRTSAKCLLVAFLTASRYWYQQLFKIQKETGSLSFYFLFTLQHCCLIVQGVLSSHSSDLVLGIICFSGATESSRVSQVEWNQELSSFMSLHTISGLTEFPSKMVEIWTAVDGLIIRTGWTGAFDLNSIVLNSIE